MAGFVLDSSVALAWHLGEKVSEQVRRLLDEAYAGGAVVPGLWHLEVANGLVTARNDGRVGGEEIEGILADLGLMPVEVDTLTARQAWTRTWKLVGKHGIRPYDAAYLELSLRLDLPLATVDVNMGEAAAKEGVLVLN